MRAKKLLSLLLVALLCMAPITALAAYSDTGDHWAEGEIDTWSDYDVLKGNPDGTFRPNGNITRGEMAIILNRVLGYQVKSDADAFTDLGATYAEAADAVLMANKAEVMLGNEGRARPADRITREEAATMIGRAFHIEESNADSEFTDSDSISDWAVGFVNALAARKFIEGYPAGDFRPKNNITRAEVVKILDNIIEGFYFEEGEVTEEDGLSGIVIINTTDVILKDTDVDGDLIFADGIAQGDSTLDTVEVTGQTVVRGGGNETINIINSHLGAVIFNKIFSGAVGFKLSGGSTTGKLTMLAGNIHLTGGYGTVDVLGDDVKITNNGSISVLNVKGNGLIFDGNRPATIVIDPSVTDPPKDSNGNLLVPTSGGGGGGSTNTGPTTPTAPTEVTLKDSDAGLVAGDKEITNLAVGKYYKVIVDENVDEIFYVDKDGKLTEDLAEIAAAASGAKIVDLDNEKTYQVNAATAFAPPASAGGKLSYWEHQTDYSTIIKDETDPVVNGVLSINDGATNRYAINLGFDLGDPKPEYEVMKICVVGGTAWTTSCCSGVYNHAIDLDNVAGGFLPGNPSYVEPFDADIPDKDVAIYQYIADGEPSWINGMSVLWLQGAGTTADYLFVCDDGSFTYLTVVVDSVALGDGSEGVPGDGEITGLTAGKYYQVIEIGTTNVIYYVKADGSISAPENLFEIEALGSAGTPPVANPITGLDNSKTYKVISATPFADGELTYWNQDDALTIAEEDLEKIDVINGVVDFDDALTSPTDRYVLDLGFDLETAPKIEYEVMKKLVGASAGTDWPHSYCSGVYNHAKDDLGVPEPFDADITGKDVGIYQYKENGSPDWINGMSALWLDAAHATEIDYIFVGSNDTFTVLRVKIP